MQRDFKTKPSWLFAGIVVTTLLYIFSEYILPKAVVAIKHSTSSCLTIWCHSKEWWDLANKYSINIAQLLINNTSPFGSEHVFLVLHFVVCKPMKITLSQSWERQSPYNVANITILRTDVNANISSPLPPNNSGLTHWGRVTHIYVGELTIIVSDNGLSPGRRQAIVSTNDGILLIGPYGTNFNEILIEILIFSFTKMSLKVSSAKLRPFCLGLNVLTEAVVTISWPIFLTHKVQVKEPCMAIKSPRW